jgi:proteasome lid subunit RPN8/RPN11
VITDVLPAPDAPSSPVYIEIRAEDWSDIYQRLARTPDLRLLGWYHSHPGLGLRLSFTDRATQKRVFDTDWQVALVVDPWRRRFRFYIGGDARPARWVAMTSEARPEAVEQTRPDWFSRAGGPKA